MRGKGHDGPLETVGEGLDACLDANHFMLQFWILLSPARIIMSSLRNAVKRRTHKERGQLKERSRLGLLEKHKDYVLRARDYNRKNAKIKTLRMKAAFKNPDEFYFKMNSSSTVNGVHQSTNNHEAVLPHDIMKAMKTQDLAYLEMKRAIDMKKIEKLQQDLHFIDAPKVNHHTIFVDSQVEVANFDPARGALSISKLPKKLNQQQDKMYKELRARQTRTSQLTMLIQKLELDRNLQKKGRRIKVQDAEGNKPAVYKWKQQRQK